jgi:VanZ family protein
MMLPKSVRRRRVFYHWLSLLVWMGLIFFLSAQPDFPRPKARWLDSLLSYMAHMFLFGVLAVLWRRALGGRPVAWPIAFALTIAYAFSDKFHQSFVPGRMADPLDLVWDGLGALLALAIWAWWSRG